MYRKPWHSDGHLRGVSFSSFIRSEWILVVDNLFFLPGDDPRNGQVLQQDRHPITGKAPKNILELRTWKFEGFLGMSNRVEAVIHITHDEVVANPRNLIGRVAEIHRLDPPENVAVPQGHYGWSWSGNEGPNEIDETDRAFILDSLDLETERRAGFSYDML